MTNKYIKKVLPVEAVQWNGDNVEEIRSLYTCRYRGSRKATGFRAPNNMIQKGTNLIVYGRANTIINIIRLSDYVVVENGFFKIVSKDRFETEYEQHDSNHTSKSSSFSLRDLVMQIAPEHIKYYIKRLEAYGFEVKSELILSSGMGEVLMCHNSQYRIYLDIDKKSFDFGFLDNAKSYKVFERVFKIEVENNNWREAFNKLVAAFPDEIMKNTNHHASLTS